MVIQELGLSTFRNYDELFIRLSDRINIFVGKNGQGKTNLLEAVHLLTHLESFRTRKIRPLIMFGRSRAVVQATIIKKDISHRTRIGLSHQGKKVWLDNVSVSRSSTYISAFYSLLFNADSLFSLRHFPSERRAFLDRFISFRDPAYFQVLKDMRVVLSQKNKLLKNARMTGLDEWNQLLIQKGYAILIKRQAFANDINVVLREIFLKVSGREEPLALRYRPSLGGEREDWAQALSRAATRERAAGHALLGPHRDEFRLVMGGSRPDESFSQGEYRIAVLALILAMAAYLEAVCGFSPLLVLDDLFSELDRSVQRQLTTYLNGLDNQIFITSTHEADGFRPEAVRVREIRAGQIV